MLVIPGTIVTLVTRHVYIVLKNRSRFHGATTQTLVSSQ
jgi:hypothetical protein